MKRGGGKRKGNAFENRTCRALSLWLTQEQDHTQFVPARLSGGWKDAGHRHAGDIAANGETGELFRSVVVVECKHHKDDLLWGLVTKGDQYGLQGFWHTLAAQAQQLRLVPMIVFRQNGKPVMVCLPLRLAVFVVSEVTGATVLQWQRVDTFGMVELETLTTVKPDRFLSEAKAWLFNEYGGK